MDELRVALAGMRARSAPGVFALEVGLLQQLFRIPLFATVLMVVLSRLLLEGVAEPILATLLTAIPKDRPAAASAARYRPISVTSVWYRWLMRVFVARVSPAMATCAGPQQHGFVPGRSVCTALMSVLPVMDLSRARGSACVVAAADIEKAYDRVDRAAMDTIIAFLGLADNPFYRLYCRCRDRSEVFLTGAGGL